MAARMDDASRTLVIATGHALSLALGQRDQVLAEHHEAIGAGHAEAVMPALSALLQPFGGTAANIRSILIEVGPGSFTGLRIGHAAASALALAWGATLDGVRSTLLVAAEHPDAARHGELAVALAAPRGQYWVERFAMPALRSLAPPQAIAADRLADWLGDSASVGGVSAPAAFPRARAALGLDRRLFSPPIPLYVREQDDVRIA